MHFFNISTEIIAIYTRCTVTKLSPFRNIRMFGSIILFPWIFLELYAPPAPNFDLIKPQLGGNKREVVSWGATGSRGNWKLFFVGGGGLVQQYGQFSYEFPIFGLFRYDSFEFIVNIISIIFQDCWAKLIIYIYVYCHRRPVVGWSRPLLIVEQMLYSF